MSNIIKIGNADVNFKVGSGDCKIYYANTQLYPSYTLLQGIERKAGYLGYIDLGLDISTDFKIEMSINYKAQAGSYFIGCDNTFRWFMATQSGSIKVFYDYNGQRITATTTNYPLNTDMVVTLENYSMVTNIAPSVKITGATQSSYTSAKTLKLYSSNLTSNLDLGVVYYVKVWKGNTLVGDFIPVINNVTDKVTMYNKVTDTFCNVTGTLYGVEYNNT